jgi:chaperonin GroES
VQQPAQWSRYHPQQETIFKQEAINLASKKVNLRPLGDRLIVEPQEQESRTTSGIILPETAKEKPQEGTVLAAGPGRTVDDGKRVTLDVKAGDVVLYARYAGNEIKIDKRKLLILKESDILAIVEK